jgi:hypothetical protein
VTFVLHINRNRTIRELSPTENASSVAIVKAARKKGDLRRNATRMRITETTGGAAEHLQGWLTEDMYPPKAIYPMFLVFFIFLK